MAPSGVALAQSSLLPTAGNLNDSRGSPAGKYNVLVRGLHDSFNHESFDGRLQNQSHMQQSYAVQPAATGKSASAAGQAQRGGEKIKINSLSTKGAGRGAQNFSGLSNPSEGKAPNLSQTAQKRQNQY